MTSETEHLKCQGLAGVDPEQRDSRRAQVGKIDQAGGIRATEDQVTFSGLRDKVAWTVPTIVGSTLYARDNRRIVAGGLGRSEA